MNHQGLMNHQHANVYIYMIYMCVYLYIHTSHTHTPTDRPHTRINTQTQSKLANILFTRELDKRLRAKGLDDKVRACAFLQWVLSLRSLCIGGVAPVRPC